MKKNLSDRMHLIWSFDSHKRWSGRVQIWSNILKPRWSVDCNDEKWFAWMIKGQVKQIWLVGEKAIVWRLDVMIKERTWKRITNKKVMLCVFACACVCGKGREKKRKTKETKTDNQNTEEKMQTNQTIDQSVKHRQHIQSDDRSISIDFWFFIV